MTRWEWTWEETEGSLEDSEEAPTARGPNRRRAMAAAAAVVLIAAAIALVTSILSSGGHARAPAARRPPVAPTLRPRRRGAAEGPEDRAIDAVMSRQAVVFEGGRRGRELALTFDDGPGPYTPALLAELRRLRVPATFFTIGEMERYFAGATRTERRLGDVIGDHTETHPMMGRLSPARQESQIVDQTQWLARLHVPFPRLFRPPFGSYDAATLAVLRSLRMLLVLWSTDTQDYTRPGVAAIVRRALAGARPGAIILMHDGGGNRSETVAALPLIVRGLRRRHLRPMTVARLLRDDPPPSGVPIPRGVVTEGAPSSAQPGA